jgi:S-DNA-T family DNA segregation ATPase FtsK/SpoIIIE
VVATAAPVIGSLALWAVTHSPYVLIFALLGPLVALASLGDTAIQGRKALRRERQRFTADVATTQDAIKRWHAGERASLIDVRRDARELMGAPRRDPERWRGGADKELFIVVGTGTVASSLVLEASDGPPRSMKPDEYAEPLDRLKAAAATLRAAPVVVDARLGIGICGPPVLAFAAARGIILQLATALSPENYEIVVSRNSESGWLASLPHTLVESSSSRAAVLFRLHNRATGLPREGTAADSVTVAVAETAGSLPRECRIMLRVEGASSSTVVPRPAEATEDTVVPEFVSREQATVFAEFLAGAAEADGLVGACGGLPDSISFASLCLGRDFLHLAEVDNDAALSSRARDTLACTPAQGLTGPLAVDLVRDGPHAIIGGTTGSGKSELLVAWVLAMAARYGPDTVTFLLVDFKGGSSFRAVQHLPHSVGLITDLDEHSARRALSSLRAELQYRERALVEAGASSIEHLALDHPLARLVIVVDEFAAMVQDFPELHELFGDIAARGRSLGVHLILCTQRPAGVVRDAVLANCTLRISLRVNNAADSIAVLGTASAAELPRFPVGRALICLAGEKPHSVQVALPCDADAHLIGERWLPAERSAAVCPRRPWCDPLPTRIPIDELLSDAHGDGLVFGLMDLPREQRRELASYSPRLDGSLIVIGGHSSGKSSVLATLLASSDAGTDTRGTAITVPRDNEGAWDIVTAQLDAVRTGLSTPCLLLIDDLDSLLGSLPEEYSFAFVDALSALLREGGRVGVHLVITARRLGSSVQPIAVLCDSRLLLRLPNKQEHVAAGGEAAEFDARLGAGGGYWHGNRVQMGIPALRSLGTRSVDTSPQPQWDRWQVWAIVSTRPADTARLLAEARSSGGSALPEDWEVIELGVRSSLTAGELAVGSTSRGRVIVADVETWQSHWALIGGLKASTPILFEGCSTTEFRAVSALRQLPPPISPQSGAVWMLAPGGEISRVQPDWKSTRANTAHTSGETLKHT